MNDFLNSEICKFMNGDGVCCNGNVGDKAPVGKDCPFIANINWSDCSEFEED